MKKTLVLLALLISTFTYSQDEISHILVTTDTYTFLETDLAECKPHIFTNTNVTATMPETSLTTFTFLPIKLLNNNSTITIIPATGVNLGTAANQQFVYNNSTLANGGDAISLYSYTDNNWGVWKGNSNVSINTYTPPVQNEYIQSNAAGDDSNTVTGFSPNSQISLLSIASTDTVLGDDYAIKLVLNQDNDNYMKNTMNNLTQGNQYEAVIRCRQPQGSSEGFFNWSGVTAVTYPETVIGANWEEKVITFTPNSATVIMKIYLGTDTNLTGDTIEISNITITDITN